MAAAVALGATTKSVRVRVPFRPPWEIGVMANAVVSKTTELSSYQFESDISHQLPKKQQKEVITLKRFLAILLMLVVSLPSVAFGQILYTVCTPGDEVNIREKPSLTSEAIGRTFLNDSYDYTERVDGFFFAPVMGIENGEGYVSASYLSIAEPVLVDNVIYITNKKSVFVRECPNGEKLLKLKKGTEVEVVMTFTDADSIDWAKTPDGYIMMKYLDEKVVEVTE